MTTVPTFIVMSEEDVRHYIEYDAERGVSSNLRSALSQAKAEAHRRGVKTFVLAVLDCRLPRRHHKTK